MIFIKTILIHCTKKVANVFLETCLFYSGFYTPLYYAGNNKLNNVAEIIKLILRDESVHGTYIGYKFQLGKKELSEGAQQKQRDWLYNFLYKLYENEEKYAALLYDTVGWTDEVMTFVRYNANKALMNLGEEPLFPETADDVNPIVINGISTTTVNHDFFSQVGNGYLMGKVEAMKDDDYLIGLDNKYDSLSDKSRKFKQSENKVLGSDDNGKFKIAKKFGAVPAEDPTTKPKK